METTSYSASKEDARERLFFVGKREARVNRQIGGCPWASTLVAWSDHFQSDIIIALACKRWGCEHCGPIKVAQMARNVERAAPTKFITLTTDAKLWPDGRTAFDGIRRKLPDFTKQIRKTVGEFEYVRILELHKNGMPHWHLLARCKYVPQTTVSSVWASLTGSVITDIRAAKTGKHAARYVMKYMCKMKHVPWTNRRISWSKKFFPKQPEEPREDWQLKHKEHRLERPAEVMLDQYTGYHATRCGNYSWLMHIERETRGSSEASSDRHLVTCIESCGE